MSGDPRLRLAELQDAYPLPCGLLPPDLFTESVRIHSVAIHLAGVATAVGNERVTGSAGSTEEVPLTRAYFELLERLAVVAAIADDDPWIQLFDSGRAPAARERRDVVFPTASNDSTFRWARSNGVAVGESWDDATRRARMELVERDRVLRSWYGEHAPRGISLSDGCLPQALTESYEFEGYVFGENSEATVVGVFGFPRNAAPLVHGFAAGATLPDAIDSAMRECLQRLGFLWGEPVPDAPPAVASTPDFHQEHYLFHGHQEALRRWLRGEHERFRGILAVAREPAEPTYVDLTPTGLASRLHVVKAVPAGHAPLVFGRGHPLLRCEPPEELAFHPIA